MAWSAESDRGDWTGFKPTGLEASVSRPVVDYNGELATSYDAGRDISPEAERTWRDAIAPHLSKTDTVVDVGAGTGRFARRLAEMVDRPVIAAEPAEGMRTAANASGARRSARWIGATAEGLPLRSVSVDVVWSAFATHYYDLPAAAVEFHRVLRRGGRVLIWHAFPEMFDELELYRWFPSAEGIDRDRMPDTDEVITTFENAGFALVERSAHQMQISSSLAAFAERLSHRAISTLRLLDDAEFEHGISQLRAHATAETGPVSQPNLLLALRRS